MSAESSTESAGCPECGRHRSAAWRRAWGEDALCRACESFAERFGTLDSLPSDLIALRHTDDMPYADVRPPDRVRLTKCRGPACCRFCGYEHPRAYHTTFEHGVLAHVTPEFELSPEVLIGA